MTRQLLFRALRREKVQPAALIEIDSREAGREAVALGMGVGVMSATEFPSFAAIGRGADQGSVVTDHGIRRLSRKAAGSAGNPGVLSQRGEQEQCGLEGRHATQMRLTGDAIASVLDRRPFLIAIRWKVMRGPARLMG